MGEGYKGSRISDRLELPPKREAITGRWRGDMLAGPATELIGNLLARPPAGGGITGPGTEECLREKEKSTLLRIPGEEREREICEVGWCWGGQQTTAPEEDRREESGAEYIVAFCYCGGRLGMSQHWDWHLNLVQCERGVALHCEQRPWRWIVKKGIGMEGKWIKKCDCFRPLRQNNRTHPSFTVYYWTVAACNVRNLVCSICVMWIRQNSAFYM